MKIVANYSLDYSKGKEALSYFWQYSQGKNNFVTIPNAEAFISWITGQFHDEHFVENLGYYIRALVDTGALNDAEVKAAIESAANNIQGNWNKFGSQTIVTSLIDAAKAFKARYVWEGNAESVEGIAANIYDTSKAIVVGVQEGVVATAGLLKYVPVVALGLATVVGYFYLTSFGRGIRKNPKYLKVDLDEMIPEHERIVKTLRHGSKKSLSKEARKQAGELSKYRKIRAR